MCDDGYDLNDPKHSTYHDRMSTLADQRRDLPPALGPPTMGDYNDAARLDAAYGCGHDGWVKGCPSCETNEAAAREAMGDD